MTARYRVYARDVLYRNLGEINDYGSLSAELRFNDVGGWHLRASASSRAASLLTETGGIIITRDNLDGLGPHVVFSGPVTDVNLDAESLEVAGASDELLFVERVASPDPAADGSAGDPYATEHDLREGTASTVLREYVSVNCGPDAITRRTVPQLTLGTDLGVGSYVYGQARWIGLLALLQDLALAGGGLRFRLLQSDAAVGEIVFTVTEATDRTASVVISQGRKTLGAWKRTIVRPPATYVYVLGQGEGINRQVIEGGDGATAAAYGRYAEWVADRRDTNDVLKLEQERSNLLAEGSEARIVSYTPLDAPSGTWGIDYDLGDLVTVITPDGEQLDEVVRGVDLTLSVPTSGTATAEVQPIVSTPGDVADDPASRQERAVNRRVSNLERNIDSLASILTVQWNVGDYRMTARTVAAPGWLLCQGQAVSRTTYAALFDVIGTTYGPGDGSTTFNLPDWRDRFPVGAGLTYVLGESGGASTADLSHTHTLSNHTHDLASHVHGLNSHTHDLASHTHTGPSHTHGAGTYAGPSHTHAAGTLAGPSHTHAAGTLAGPSHTHDLSDHVHGLNGHTHDLASHTHDPGTFAGPSHTHAAGTYAGPSHTHAAGTYAGPSHTHTLDHFHDHSHSGTTDAPSATSNRQDGANSVASATHTHTFSTNSDTSAPNTTTTSASGTGSVTGSSAADGTGSVTGSSAAGGTGAVTGTSAGPSTNTSGAPSTTNTDVPGPNASGSGGTGAVTGSSAAGGTGSVTGSTASEGTGSVTGTSGSGGTGDTGTPSVNTSGLPSTTNTQTPGPNTSGTPSTNTSGSGGSAAQSIVPPYRAVNYEVYAGA